MQYGTGVRNKINMGDYEVPMEWPTLATHDNTLARIEARRKYHAEQMRLKEQFKQDLEIEFGVYQHTKADKVFQLAWQLGHAGGHHEVLSQYVEIVDLIK